MTYSLEKLVQPSISILGDAFKAMFSSHAFEDASIDQELI